MTLRKPIIGGAILGAGGLGYWFSAPAIVATALLGASSACGCAARLSDYSESWANCAVGFAAVETKLDTLFEGADGTMSEAVPTKLRTRSKELNHLLAAIDEAGCGTFTAARKSDLELEKARQAASFEHLYIPGTFEDALVASSAGGHYWSKRAIEVLRKKSIGSPDA